MNFKYWLNQATNILSMSNSPRRDAEIILEFVTGKNRTFIIAFDETLITKEQGFYLEKLLNRRKLGEPIAYIIGKCEFWSLTFSVSAVTLIPRPDTECLIENALMILSDKPSLILDLGTGTGAIALSLASERPDCKLIATDLLPEVVDLASYNKKKLGRDNVHILQSYWFNSLINQKFDMIISNPPYININDSCLYHGDLRFEPLTALVSDNNGIADLKHIIFNARKHLVTDGYLLVEHGWNQGKIVRKYFIQAGYKYVKTHYDYNNKERITLGMYSN